MLGYFNLRWSYLRVGGIFTCWLSYLNLGVAELPQPGVVKLPQPEVVELAQAGKVELHQPEVVELP